MQIKKNLTVNNRGYKVGNNANMANFVICENVEYLFECPRYQLHYMSIYVGGELDVCSLKST